MPTPYIDTLLRNLNDSEKKSIEYHFSSENTSDNALLKKYIYATHKVNLAKNGDLNVNRMLKSRAFDEVTDILTSSYHINNKGNFSPQDQLQLKLKKKCF